MAQHGARAYQYADSTWVALDVAPTVAYAPLQKLLQKGEEQQHWEYQEACLGWK
jgi:hypothetical protein